MTENKRNKRNKRNKGSFAPDAQRFARIVVGYAHAVLHEIDPDIEISLEAGPRPDGSAATWPFAVEVKCKGHVIPTGDDLCPCENEVKTSSHNAEF